MVDNKANNKRIAKNSIFLSIRLFIVLIITLYTTRVVLRNLGIVDFGVFNVVCGFVAMFAFLNTSMTNGIQRFYNYEIARNGTGGICKVYNTALRIQFLLSLLVVIIAETFGLWYIHNKMVIPEDRYVAALIIYQCAIFSFIFVIMQVPYSAITMAKEKMDYYAIVGVIDAILKLLIAIALPYIPQDKLIAYGVLIAIISLLNFILYFFYAKKSFDGIYYIQKIDKKLFSSMLSFSGWNLFGSFSGIMKEQGINLILNLFFGPIVNAARGVAHQVNGGLTSLVSNLSIAVRPQVIQSYSTGDTKRTMKLTYSISKLSCGVLYLFALPVVLEINFILKVWLGDYIPIHTNTFIIIIIIISFVNNLNSAVSGVIHASGQMATYQVVSSSISLLCLPAAYFVLKCGYSPEWALIMTFTFTSLSQIASLFIMKKIINYSIIDYIKQIICPLIYFIILSIWIPLCIHYFFPVGWGRFISTLFISFCVSGLLMYFVLFDSSERNLVKLFVHRKKMNSFSL